MSGFKIILVPVGDAAVAAAPLQAAFRLAAETSGHVVGLHVRVDPAMAVPLVGEGMSGAMVEEMLAAAERQAAVRAAAARTLFDRVAADAGVTSEWVDVVGREEEVVVLRGRLADVVVVGRPGNEPGTPSPMTLNAALMESGRPLLVVPATLPDTLGRHAAIAWNGSAEAVRAVASGLALLRRAETVTILSVSEDERTVAVPAGDLAAYLARHGVQAACRRLPAAAHAGVALLAECATLGADLLVMGAYTHSRLRQMILGGVTRHVLHHAELSCLMCH